MAGSSPARARCAAAPAGRRSSSGATPHSGEPIRGAANHTLRHCSLRKDYTGDADLVARLADNQTVYDVDYLSLFCYQYDAVFL